MVKSAVVKMLVAWLFVGLVLPTAVSAPASNLPELRLARLQATPAPVPSAAVVDGSMNRAFVPQATLRVSSSPSTEHWYRLELSDDWRASEPPVVSFQSTQCVPCQMPVWIYVPPAYHPHLLGIGISSALSRDISATPLPGDLRAGQAIYVRIGKSNSGNHPHALVTLDDLSGFLTKDRNVVRLVTFFESVQAAMLLIGLFMWLLLRDRLFLYFFGYIGAQLLYAMSTNGELFRLPGGWLFLTLHGRASMPFAMLTAVLAISFIIEFCDLRHSVPRAAKVFGAMRWPLLATTPLILYSSSHFDWLVFPLLNMLILLSCVAGIGSVLIALMKGNRQARFFFVAWLPELLFVIWRVIQLQAGWDLPAWAHYGFQASMAFATLIITVGLADQTLHARRERDIADNLANHDPLTGALNRRAILSRLEAAVVEACRDEQPLAVLFLDVDHFKSINDNYGHAAGDRCLQEIVKVVARELRGGDWMGRFGGEEFVVVLPDANAERARIIGERVRAAIEAHPLQIEGKSVRVTASIGVTGIIDSHDSANTLLERADLALYRAKSSGRNRISMQTPVASGA